MSEQTSKIHVLIIHKHWPPGMKTIPRYMYVIAGFYCWQDTSVPHTFLATTPGPFPGSTLLTPRGFGTSPRKTGKSIIHLLYKMNSKFGMQCMALHYLWSRVAFMSLLYFCKEDKPKEAHENQHQDMNKKRKPTKKTKRSNSGSGQGGYSSLQVCIWKIFKYLYVLYNHPYLVQFRKKL